MVYKARLRDWLQLGSEYVQTFYVSLEDFESHSYYKTKSLLEQFDKQPDGEGISLRFCQSQAIISDIMSLKAKF